MQMASSALLFLSLSVVILFSVTSAYNRQWSSPNDLTQNPIRIIEAAIGVSDDLLMHNRIEAKSSQLAGQSQTIVVGPWGAKVTSSNGVDFDDGAYTGIREINFGYNNETAIGGFQVTYDVNGVPFEGKNHTSFITGFTPVKILLDFPIEFITEVSGYTGNMGGYIVVRSLKFKTNKKTYGPYGVTSGTPFSLPIETGLIVGFKGSIGYWLDNIGFHLSL